MRQEFPLYLIFLYTRSTSYCIVIKDEGAKYIRQPLLSLLSQSPFVLIASRVVYRAVLKWRVHRAISSRPVYNGMSSACVYSYLCVRGLEHYHEHICATNVSQLIKEYKGPISIKLPFHSKTLQSFTTCASVSLQNAWIKEFLRQRLYSASKQYNFPLFFPSSCK